MLSSFARGDKSHSLVTDVTHVLSSCLVVVCLLAVIADTSRAEQTIVLEDFDGPVKLSARWTAFGEIAVERASVPADLNFPGVRSRLVACNAKRGSMLAVRADFPRPQYEKADLFRFRAMSSTATKDQPLTVEVRMHSAERKAQLWRKVTFDSSGWQTIELPLHFFRCSPGAIVQWREAARFGFYFRTAGNLSIDAIELVQLDDDASPNITEDELNAIAFAGAAETYQSEHFSLLTNDDRVAAADALEQFEILYQLIRKDFPELREPTRPAVMLVFRERRSYQEFWPSLGARLASTIPVPKSSGYTVLGISASYYSPEFQGVRPVWIHEACHAMLSQTLGLANSGEWLQEGLANYYQLRWTKQDIDRLNRERLLQERHRPLRELLDGQPISMDEYAQVALITKWLIEVRRDQFVAAIKSMYARSSTALGPVCQQHFGMSLEELEADWIHWAHNRLR